MMIGVNGHIEMPGPSAAGGVGVNGGKIADEIRGGIPEEWADGWGWGVL
jgi:hypothetical protein